jgi:CubicO group peptidase (beta-lactamase class C family)
MKNVLLAALLVLLLAAPAGAQPGIPPIRSLAQLQDSLRAVMAREHIPGLMLTLVSHDSVLFEGGLGLADVAARRPVTAHTRFRIGSITKTFVAAGLMQLIEQGKLHLNDEVRKIAPEIPIDNPWEATDPVRVVHLLEHTAGFDDMGLNHIQNTLPTDPRGLATLAILRNELRCRWRPGERMSYSNPGYQVAGYLLEKLSGQPYEQYLTEHFLRPLAMPDASPALRLVPGPGLSRGYGYADGQYQAVALLPIYLGPAGSVSASAADLTQWVQFFLHEGRTPDGRALLQPPSLRELEIVHSSLARRAGLSAGYGLANASLGLQGKALFRGHGGGMIGFISAFGYNRALGVGYAFSNNGGQRVPKLEQLVQAFLLRQLPARPPAPAVPLDAAAVAPYLGHYRSAAPRNEIAGIADYLMGGTNLRRQGNFLLNAPLIGKADTLLPTGPLTFRRPSEQTATTALTQDREGRRVLVAALTPEADYALAAGFWWWLPPALLALCVLLVVSSSLAALVGLVRVLRRRLPRAQLLPRLLPLLALAALATTAWALVSYFGHLTTDGHPGLPAAIAASLGPLLFVAFILAGVVLTVRYFGQFRRSAVAWYLLLTYGALGWLAAVLGSYGWMSLRLWGA